ncbi:GrpB family protein [Inconstantimicrobium porci]|uniref:GrpB family protein n=1 Tax=Inconstantimicrobium porci TaxID=2652291 RepID=UPI0030C71819
MRTKHVVVLPYDQKWNDEFNKIKDELLKELNGKVISIEHVGSTSVKGLSENL